MIISIYTEKSIDKIQHPFMIKKTLRIEEYILNMMKTTYINPHLTYLLVKDCFPQRLKKEMLFTFTSLIQHSAGISRTCNKAGKVNKRHTYQKERKKTVSIWR